MKKTYLAVVVSLLSASASAFATGNQVASSHVANHGNISNIVQSSASVNGVGTAYSAATGAAGAESAGKTSTSINTVPGTTKSGTVSFEGTSSSYTNGTAFNVSSGNGTGAAKSVGSANADVVGGANYSGPGQWVAVSGDSTSHSNGGVTAGANQGGYFTSATNGAVKVDGLVGSKVTTNGTTVTKEVVGKVADTKSTSSNVATGPMTVDGKVLNQAPVNASASTVVNARGAYGDPL